MKKIIDYFQENTMLVNLITVLILVAGTFSLFLLKRDMFPAIDFDTTVVRTTMLATSSEEIEKLITIPIERELKGVEGIDNINSLSIEGASIVTVRIDPDYDTDKVNQKISDSVARVKNLPSEADKPNIRRIENLNTRIISIGIYGNKEDEIVKRAKILQSKLEAIKEVATVQVKGERDKYYSIRVDLNKLNQNELTLSDISQVIKSKNLNLSAGKVVEKNFELNVRTVSEIKKKEDLENIVVRSNKFGKKVLLKNVADTDYIYEEEKIIEKINGEKSIILNVLKKQSSDMLVTNKLIKKVTSNYFKNIENVKFNFSNERAYFVKRRLGSLRSSALMGVLLVFICLLLLFDTRTSLVTAFGAPIAFMMAFVFLEFFDVSLNLISMFGLILVLGMLVDDSIIVAEQFYQNHESGMSIKESARNAAMQTLKPITATILTTICAFGALTFMGGIMGKFLIQVPIVVIVCLLASWFECFFILPNHLSDFVKPNKKEGVLAKYFKVLKIKYKGVLYKTLKRPLGTVSIFVIVLIGSLVILKTMKFELFPGDDVEQVRFYYKGLLGTGLDTTNSKVQTLERIISSKLNKNEMETYATTLGQLQGSHGFSKTGPHYANVVIYLTSKSMRSRTSDEIIKSVLDETKIQMPDDDITVSRMKGGPPQSKAVDIEIYGDDLDELLAASKEVKRDLEKVKGISTVEIDYEEGKNQMILSIDENESKRLGVSVSSIAFEVRRVFEGEIVTSIRRSDKDIDVKLELSNKLKDQFKTLDDIFVYNNQGKRIKINKLISFTKQPGSFVIRRLNQKRIISVFASIDKKVSNSNTVKNDFLPTLEGLMKKYDNLNYEFGGENKDTKKSLMRWSKSFIIALFFIFIILVVMFSSLLKPFIIMSSIPFSLIGVIISFKIFNMSLGFMALMGIIGLVGVVVNDSIVLLNHISTQLKSLPDNYSKEDLLESISNSSSNRFRQVILTTITTFVGLFPLAHSVGGDPFLKPMALSFAWGLVFATALTLIYVPSLYTLFIKFNILKVKS